MLLGRKRPRMKIRLLAMVALVTALMLIIDSRMRPMIETYAVNQASSRVTEIINQSVYQEMSGVGVNYQSLVTLTHDQSGNITSLQTNIVELNKLQSRITQRIIGHVMEFDSQTIKVSLGALLGGPVFSGRGPDIEIKLIPANFIETHIFNSFKDSGINQTRHQVIMDISLTVTAVMPGYRSSTNIDTNVVLAETIIVGRVPEAFTNVLDGSDPLVGLIQDYGATVE